MTEKEEPELTVKLVRENGKDKLKFVWIKNKEEE